MFIQKLLKQRVQVLYKAKISFHLDKDVSDITSVSETLRIKELLFSESKSGEASHPSSYTCTCFIKVSSSQTRSHTSVRPSV